MKVRDAIKLVEADGWFLVGIKGSHRQFEHATKSGKVTIPGPLNDDVPKGTLANIIRQAQLKEHKP